jgi:tubulin polyglutamylase TTLL6/13
MNTLNLSYDLIKEVAHKDKDFKLSENEEIEWDIMWCDTYVSPNLLVRMKPFQRTNHFPGMYSLTKKNYLARNLTRMAKNFHKEYNFFPKTWVLPYELNDLKT